MSKGHAVLKFLRKVHLYLGIFTTPALLFFALTGAMQTFSLHETTQGSHYQPPKWIATLAQIHKKQDTAVPVHKLRPGAAETGDHAAAVSSAGDGSAAASRHGADRAEGAPQATPAQPADGAGKPSMPKSHLPLKIFFLLVAVSLAISTLTGVYMSYKYNRGWLTLTGLLAAGLAIPLLLLAF